MTGSGMGRNRSHRVINLYGPDQADAVDNAMKAARRDVGEDASEGELLRAIANSYTGNETYEE